MSQGLEWNDKETAVNFLKIGKESVIHITAYLLRLVIRSAKDFSQAYIFIILMPVITSFMVLILASVKAAVLLLRGQRRAVSHGPHTPTALFHRGPSQGPGADDSLQLFCADDAGRSSSQHTWGRTSVRTSSSSSKLENWQYLLRKVLFRLLEAMVEE